MKKYYFILLFFGMLAAGLVSCSKDDKEEYIPIPPEVSIENLSGKYSVLQKDTITLKAKVKSVLETSLSWTVGGKKVSADSIYKFACGEIGKYEVSLTASNADGEVSASVSVEVYGQYRYGTFVLNEGSSSAGTLIFISPEGMIADSVYYRENGTFLGNGCQDLFIQNNKMYIVSQNGGNDGFLVIANAETLKKERSFQDELKGKLNWLSHIAVLSENDIYLRDNSGVSRFNPSTQAITFIKGSKGARKNTMAVTSGKVFVSSGKYILVVEAGQDTITGKIELSGAISGIIPSSDGDLWVSCAASGGENAKILKVSSKNYSIIQTNVIGDNTASGLLAAGWLSTPSITAKGDTLYMGGEDRGAKPIYRHIFSQNKTDMMVDITKMVDNSAVSYNTIAVNPVTGEVFANTLKGWGQDYLINQLTAFDFSGTEPKVSAAYKDHTRFPGGIFFTYNFK